MAKYEEKFVVLNKNHLDNLPDDIRESFRLSLSEVQTRIPKNKYYVCNQDESYSDEVLGIIMEGEDLKAKEDNRLVTVCDQCFKASCWQGIFLCEDSLNAGTVEKTVKELKSLNYEHSDYWDKDC